MRPYTLLLRPTFNIYPNLRIMALLLQIIHGLRISPVTILLANIPFSAPSDDYESSPLYYNDYDMEPDSEEDPSPRDLYYHPGNSKYYTEDYGEDEEDLEEADSNNREERTQYEYGFGGHPYGGHADYGGGYGSYSDYGHGPGPGPGFRPPPILGPGGPPPPFGFPDPGFKTQVGFEGLLVPNSWYGLLPWGIEGVVIVIAGIIVFVIIVVAILGLLAWLCGIKKTVPFFVKKDELITQRWKDDRSSNLANISASVFSAFDKFGGGDEDEDMEDEDSD